MKQSKRCCHLLSFFSLSLSISLSHTFGLYQCDHIWRNFATFAQNFKFFRNFWYRSFSIWQTLVLTLAIFYATGQIFIVVNDRILKNNLAIRSHCTLCLSHTETSLDWNTCTEDSLQTISVFLSLSLSLCIYLVSFASSSLFVSPSPTLMLTTIFLSLFLSVCFFINLSL